MDSRKFSFDGGVIVMLFATAAKHYIGFPVPTSADTGMFGGFGKIPTSVLN
jgi:hypothetical protein